MSIHRHPSSGPVTAVLGPTNTGKTHYALERMLGHETGMIGLPLRLLAREVYDKVVDAKGSGAVALITGEEKILPRAPKYYVCTVEAMPLSIPVAFAAVDEIQLADDRDRGHIFTDRLLHLRGTEETMVLGAETIRPLIKLLLPGTKFVTRPRYSNLSFAGSKKLSRLPRRSAIVAFSAEEVYAIAELIRRQRGGAAVVMGALSPKTRNAQVALYQAGEVDYLVATDAVGMGLNMDVDHVAFASLSKFDGLKRRPLTVTELAQIAGRAGRYMNDGTFGTTADAPALDPDTAERIESHQFDPLSVLMWRNRTLNFSSPSALITSLELPAPRPGLARTKSALDVISFKALRNDETIKRKLGGPATVKTLWEICQVPDFRKVMIDEHIGLLRTLSEHLLTSDGHIPEDWLAPRVAQTESTDGDIDTIANRIAHCRTWTFISNRSGWLQDAAHWRDRTRQIEEKLSDALHEKLTQRFVDRRTSILVKSLRERTDLLAGVSDDGEVTVEGHFVGRLQGLQFNADPRAAGIHGRALRHAASKALSSEIRKRAELFLNCGDSEISLSDNGKICWQGATVGRLANGIDWFHPKIELSPLEQVDSLTQKKLRQRLDRWLVTELESRLPSVAALVGSLSKSSSTQLSANARGLIFRLFENYGWLRRKTVQMEVSEIEKDERAILRRMGVRIGEFAIWQPDILKPQGSAILRLLYEVWNGHERLSIPALTNRGLTSLPREAGADPSLYALFGYVNCGPRFVRIDIVEKLGDLVRSETKPFEHFCPPRDESADPFIGAMLGIAPKGKPKKRKKTNFVFAPSPRMTSLVGCSEKELAQVLSALGFKRFRLDQLHEGADELVLWQRNVPRADKPRNKHRKDAPEKDKKRKNKTAKGALSHSPFAALEKLQTTR